MFNEELEHKHTDIHVPTYIYIKRNENMDFHKKIFLSKCLFYDFMYI